VNDPSSLPGISTRHVEDVRFAHLAPHVWRLVPTYRARQWSAEDLLQVQTERLQATLADAVGKVPWYRDVGVSVDHVAADPWAALERFPLLSKEHVRSSLESLTADDFDPISAYRVMTSGSTGVPLTLLQDEDNLIHEAASYARVFEQAGIRPGDRICRINSDFTRPEFATTVQLLPCATELAVFNLLDVHRNWSSTFVHSFARWEPVAVFGNPSDVEAATLLLRDARWQGSVRSVLTAGENLSARSRRVIQETFDAPVFDIYSMQELRGLAWQCQQGTMHVNEDRVIVDSIREPGRDPELLITTLTNRTMPLIRYRTADLGEYRSAKSDPCACGRSLGRITAFDGRDRGFVALPDGKLVGPKPIKEFLTGLDVAAWQLVQRAPDRIDIHLVAYGAKEDDDLKTKVERVVRDLTDPAMDVRADWVQRVDLLQGVGKFQMMVLLPSRLSGIETEERS
jgi:phenylacetate-CoA ligase